MLSISSINQLQPKNLSKPITTSDNVEFTFKDVLRKIENPQKNPLEDPKIQQRVQSDLKRIASLMGIGPKILSAVIGDLRYDAGNFDFKVETNADEAVKSVSDYFGISPMTMFAVFDKLGIDKQDLVDKEKSGKVTLKLKEFFGLNLEQEKELSKLIDKYVKIEESNKKKQQNLQLS